MTEDRDTHKITDDETLDGDRAGGWAGVPEALGEAVDRPAESGQAESSLDDGAPGSQGEIEAGSEGDFGHRDR